MTNRQLRSLQEAVASHRPERGKHYSPELRERIVAFALARHDEGTSWETIASELGLATETLRAWRSAEGRSTTAMVPVSVVEDVPSEGVRVVSPSGFRIEGLVLDEAVYVLRALG